MWTPRVVDELDSLDTRDRAKALLAAGIAYCDFVNDKRAIDWLVEAEGIFRQLGHERGLGSVLFWLGRGASARDDLDLAERVFTESLAVHDRLGDLFGWGWSKTNLGNIARKRGDLDRCEAMQHEVLARCERIPQVVGAAYGGLSQVAGLRGEVELAMAYNALALDIYRDLDDRWQVALVLEFRGWLTVGVSLDASAACVLGALRGFQEIGSDPDTRQILICAAGLLQQAGRSEEAAVLAGGVQDLVAQDMGHWPKPARTMVVSLRTMVAQPAAAIPLERGRRLGVRNAADAAIEWLERAYPTSASISV